MSTTPSESSYVSSLPEGPSPVDLTNFDPTLADMLHYTPQDESPIEGNAYLVHNAFNNIKDNFPKISKALGKPTISFKKFNEMFMVLQDQFMMYLQDHFFRMLIGRKTNSSQDRQEYLEQVEQILQKLYEAGNFVSSETMNNMFNWSQFVLRQPTDFQIAYFDCFLEDTYNAYDSDTDGISCPKGIYERMLFSIGDACVIYCTEYEKKKKSATKKSNSGSSKKNKTVGRFNSLYSNCEKSKYIKLIKLFKKEIPEMNDLIQQWSSILDRDEGKNMEPKLLKENFIAFLKNTYLRYGIDNTKKINQMAEDLDYVFKNKEFGGGYRRIQTLKTRTRTRTKT